MSQANMPKDNGWVEKGRCLLCGWIGSKRNVCPSCGAYNQDMGTTVARWVSTLKWYHAFSLECGNRGYWEEKK